MKKLILAGLLSIGVANACDTKEYKKFIKRVVAHGVVELNCMN